MTRDDAIRLALRAAEHLSRSAAAADGEAAAELLNMADAVRYVVAGQRAAVPFEDFRDGLNRHIRQILARRGIDTAERLLAARADELLALRNFGVDSMRSLAAAVAGAGYEVPPSWRPYAGPRRARRRRRPTGQGRPASPPAPVAPDPTPAGRE